MAESCPLCNTKGSLFFQNKRHVFYICGLCHGIFRDSKQLLDREDEEERYLHHQSDINDTGYHHFVLPIINKVKAHFESGKCGLDYGCGHTPVLSRLLSDENYNMEIFDAIFFNEKAVFDKKYHFIVCCEVMEHFYKPCREFKGLFELLLSGGKLICKTHLYEKGMDFDAWYYKNDPSHVFIYQKQTLEWIKDHFKCSGLEINKRLITFSK